VQQLERTNKRLERELSAASRKSKRDLVQRCSALEAEVARQARERAMMEETLTAAYNATIHELVTQLEAATARGPAPSHFRHAMPSLKSVRGGAR